MCPSADLLHVSPSLSALGPTQQTNYEWGYSSGGSQAAVVLGSRHAGGNGTRLFSSGQKQTSGSPRADVRFTPVCGRLRVDKSFLHICSSIGRCARVFGLFARHTWPLAIMPCADQVPNESPHSTMRRGKWVVLIARSTGSALRAARPPNLHIAPDVRRDLVYAASATGSL